MPPQQHDECEAIEDAVTYDEDLAYWKKVDKRSDEIDEYYDMLELDDLEEDCRKEPHKSKIKRPGHYVEVKQHGVLLKKFPCGSREVRKELATYRSTKSHKQVKRHLDDGCRVPFKAMGVYSMKWMQRECKPMRHKRECIPRDFSVN